MKTLLNFIKILIFDINSFKIIKEKILIIKTVF